jgi:hypothetical protein
MQIDFEILYNKVQDANYTWATIEEAFGPEYEVVGWRIEGGVFSPKLGYTKMNIISQYNWPYDN